MFLFLSAKYRISMTKSLLVSFCFCFSATLKQNVLRRLNNPFINSMTQIVTELGEIYLNFM